MIHCNKIFVFSSVTVELPSKVGRKLLRRLIQDEPQTDDLKNQEKENEPHQSALSPVVIGMGIPGILVLCCSFLCPCFRAKSKEADHSVLPKEHISGKLGTSQAWSFQFCDKNHANACAIDFLNNITRKLSMLMSSLHVH